MTTHRGVSFALLMILLLVTAGLARAQEARPVGRVETVEGDVQAIAPASGEQRVLTAGAALFEGDLVQTGPEGRARLQLADGSTLQLGNDTDLELSWILADASSGIREMALTIPRGIVRAIVEAIFPQSAVRIGTTTAVTSVRGTDWITQSQPDTSAVVVLDGRVEVASVALPGADVLLGPGEGTDVAAGEPPTAPARWGDARREDFIQRTAPPAP